MKKLLIIETKSFGQLSTQKVIGHFSENKIGYRDKENTVEIVIVKQDNSLIIKKKGKTTFECLHKINKKEIFQMKINESGVIFHTEIELLTKDIVINQTSIEISYLINEEKIEIKYYWENDDNN